MRASFSLSLVALVLAGCRGDSPQTASVSGRVTLNGRPLPNAAVMFQPIAGRDEINPGPGSVGTTDANGRYSLRVVGKNWKGAVVGKHRVRISLMEKEVSSDDSPKPPGFLQEKYYRKSQLQYDVPDEGTSDANFDLTSGP
jgi:hypothetical protein